MQFTMHPEILHQLSLIIKRKIMKKNQIKNSKKQSKKGYEIDYSQDLEAMVLNIYDTDGMIPLYVRYPKAGLYKIIETKSGGFQMEK